MKDYREFEEKVKVLSGQFEDWKHVLPAVPAEHRTRYLEALVAGLDMPGAFDTVMLCKDAPEDVFRSIVEKLKKR